MNCGCEIYRTDLHGEITITIKNGKVNVNKGLDIEK